jgi:tetratricopeptide (TPR) repeat protein
MANADSYKAEYPDYDLTDEEIAEAVDNRVGMLLVKDGWARAHRGETDEALADFARADKLVPRFYFDVPEYDLNLYWAQALMMKGDLEAAIEKYAFQGLVMGNEEAMAGLKKSYVGLHGNDSDFDTFATKLHYDIAPTFDGFELPDYDGKRRRFSNLRGDVTLVSFWFPT